MFYPSITNFLWQLLWAILAASDCTCGPPGWHIRPNQRKYPLFKSSTLKYSHKKRFSFCNEIRHRFSGLHKSDGLSLSLPRIYVSYSSPNLDNNGMVDISYGTLKLIVLLGPFGPPPAPPGCFTECLRPLFHGTHTEESFLRDEFLEFPRDLIRQKFNSS